jgi:molybdenum cofactor synthesis domain-containing protein
MTEDPIRVQVISISDTRTEKDDLSGAELINLFGEIGAYVHDKVITSDDIEEIKLALLAHSDRDDVDLIITTGGTGLSPRDNTPEATLAVIEREAPGIAEAMRRDTSNQTPLAMLSRGVCGMRGRVLIINLPGSPKAVAECFEVIRSVIRHAIEQAKGSATHH